VALAIHHSSFIILHSSFAMRSPPRVPRPMQPTPIVLPGEGAESSAGAKLDAAVSPAAAWPVLRKNSRRLRMDVSFIDQVFLFVDSIRLLTPESEVFPRGGNSLCGEVERSAAKFSLTVVMTNGCLWPMRRSGDC
jgi:hypothetical protein